MNNFKINFKKIGPPSFFGNFTQAPHPEDIKTVEGLPKRARQLLQCLEIRAEENRGDTKFYDQAAADILGVSKRQINRYIKLLIDRNLIGTCNQKLRTPSGGLKTDRTFRCWRVVIKYRFLVRSKPLWKRDTRPKMSPNFASHLNPRWLVSDTVVLSRDGQTFIVKPMFENLIELSTLNLWNLGNYEAFQLFKHQQQEFSPSSLKVLGYPSKYKMKRLGWKETDIADYETN